MSYSQNDEEKYILEAVGESIGVFLDIGAYDGKSMSNTLALTERGWAGVMVEPSPDAFKALLDRHGDNPDLFLVHALVGVEPGIVKFWNCKGDAVSTTKAERFARWNTLTEFTKPFYTPQITLPQLFEALPILRGVHVVSIDTEGTSFDLFNSFPLKMGRLPKVFCVEYDEHENELRAASNFLGYDVTYRSGENLVLRRRD